MKVKTIEIPIDSLNNKQSPMITNTMKKYCHGGFSWEEDAPYYDENGNVIEHTAVREVPWDLCKQIYKQMATMANASPEIEEDETEQSEEYETKVNQITRAFWRRINAYKNEYEKELPETLPVEFRCSMAAALSWLDLEEVMEAQKELRVLKQRLTPLNKHNPESMSKFIG